MGIEGPWTHEQAVVGDVRLHYAAAGEAGDPLVVLLHGFPEFWYSWRHQLVALADAGFRAVALDMRGYNRSEKPRGVGRYRTDELVGDVVGLVDHLGAESAHVVGHDWGGLVAWATAIRRPDAVDRLAVLNAPHPDRYRRALGRNLDQWRRSWYAMAFQLPWLPEAVLGVRDCEGVVEMLRETSNPDTFSDADLRRYREAADRPGALTGALNYYRAAFREGLGGELRALVGRSRRSESERVPNRSGEASSHSREAPGRSGETPGRSGEVSVPTLLVWGEQDPALGVELTEGLGRWVPDLRVERLSEATHWVQNDRAEEVNELLLGFWDER